MASAASDLKTLRMGAFKAKPGMYGAVTAKQSDPLERRCSTNPQRRGIWALETHEKHRGGEP